MDFNTFYFTENENPQIYTKEFKDWFGDWEHNSNSASKVVDKDGKPLVVYHGTRQEFNSFSKDKSGVNHKFVKKGQFFTDNTDEADFYTDKQDYDYNVRMGDSPNIKPVYLKIKNPIVREVKGNATNYFDSNIDIFFSNAKKNKNDGIIVRGGDESGNIYITFLPNQIKSATGNNGKFNKNSDNINEADNNYDLLYPIIKTDTLNDLTILDNIPNQSSIESTLYDYEILPNIREVKMDNFSEPNTIFYAKSDFDKSRSLAEKIKINKQISPLIIVVDKDGPYILEGAHRYVALYYLGIKSFPAMIVIDNEDINYIL
jgi:hypothetical protein